MTKDAEKAEDVERWFREELKRLWPAGLGSLSLRRSPCTREHCHVCETGEQHPSYVLYGRRDGRRATVYIPDELAPEIEQALRNGRRLQDILYEAARRFALARKRERASKR